MSCSIVLRTVAGEDEVGGVVWMAERVCVGSMIVGIKLRILILIQGEGYPAYIYCVSLYKD